MLQNRLILSPLSQYFALVLLLIVLFSMSLLVTGCSKAVSPEATPSIPQAETTATIATPAEVQSRADDAKNSNIQADEQLGTKWGDEVESVVTTVDLERVTAEPIYKIAVTYADKAFTGTKVNDISLLAGQISFKVTDDNGNTLPMYRTNGNYYIKARAGQSYQLSYTNHSQKIYEIVASVDGLDVLDGQAASVYKDGYVLDPGEGFIIKGFGKSDKAVASFTFSKPGDAYANHNIQGSIVNTGIIGTAIYELKQPNKATTKPSYAPPPTNKPNAFPNDK